jgi:hypothetical protein
MGLGEVGLDITTFCPQAIIIDYELATMAISLAIKHYCRGG